MSEKAVRRKKKKDDQEDGAPTDEEKAVAKHLRFNLATKSCNFMGNKVEYFTGSKAVDFLMDSKWATADKAIFTTRESITRYLDVLLQKGFYMRALKVPVKKKEKEAKEPKGKKESKKTEKEKSEKDKSEKEAPQEGAEKKEKKEKSRGEDSGEKKKEGKRKIKLEGTNEQKFVDGNDAYVWIFDPTRPMHYVYGLGLVIAAVAVCMFPLWPMWMRAGTYYLSVGGACLVGSIVVLAIVRTIIYGIIWGITMGKISWWLFPNLLADVGILESFQPIYSVEYGGKDEKGKKKKGKDDDDEAERESEEDEKDNNEEKHRAETETEKVEEIGIKDSENDDPVSEDGPSEEGPESLGTESGNNQETGSNQDEENVSQTSDKSESSSSQGSKDFEVVQREDVIDADTASA